MRKALLFLTLGCAAAAGAQKKDYAISAVDFTQVKLNDRFWLPRIQTNHTVTIPASFQRCESTGRVKNFVMAAARSGKFGTTFPFDDTDIYKTIEGASYSLSLFRDPKLEAYIDTLIGKVAAAQESDGYLYTARTIDPEHPHDWAGKTRWEKERDMSHELYNAGHLYESAVAHYKATGKKTLLKIALKNADLVCSVFGPGKQHVAPGHEIVEMGLVKLYRLTGKKEYLETAIDFVGERGKHKGYDPKNKDPFKNGAYWQDHKPVTLQEEAIGHAVRATYLYSGMADIAALTGDTAILRAIDAIWKNMVAQKIYVQGGIGAVGSGERFGNGYELPNATAYNETCASIGNIYWNQRMFQLHGDARYIDVLEKSLYNSMLSGLGLDGKSFFYSNAMQVRHSHLPQGLEQKRSGWFDCSCCPTNLVRLLPSIPGYMYGTSEEALFINLFISSKADINFKGQKFSIEQSNDYPWQGALRFVVTPQRATSGKIMLRIPGWARNEVLPSDLYQYIQGQESDIKIRINGQAWDYRLVNGYALIDRKWSKGDVIELQLPMEPKLVRANGLVKEDRGKVALQYGPLVYCAEGWDNGGQAANIILPTGATLKASYQPGLLHGVTTISAQLPAVITDRDHNRIYTEHREVKFIPYYSWANRGESEMMVWFPSTVTGVELLTEEPTVNKK